MVKRKKQTSKIMKLPTDVEHSIARAKMLIVEIEEFLDDVERGSYNSTYLKENEPSTYRRLQALKSNIESCKDVIFDLKNIHVDD